MYSKLILALVLLQESTSIGGVVRVNGSRRSSHTGPHESSQRALQTSGSVENLRLINAVTDLPIMNLTNGVIINLSQQATSQFNIQATTANGTVRSIRFAYNGRPNFRTESAAPFAFCGDGNPNGNYNTCSVLTLGQHNVTATPFSGDKATGAMGVPFRVSFSIINVPPTKAPTHAPTTSPTKAPTRAPTTTPTKVPTKSPMSTSPTKTPTKMPTTTPTKAPTKEPTQMPTKAPAKEPTKIPTMTPTVTPTKAPTFPPTAAPQALTPTCKIPQFIDATWQTYNPAYPIRIGESQGLMVGNDIVIMAGFTDNFSSVTNQTYARDMTVANSSWRRMDDMPLEIGVTHAATVLIGTKVYLCGGYWGGHPGPHIPYCFIYDHSIAPGSGLQWTRFTDLPIGGTAGAGMVYDTARNALYYAGGGQRLTPGSVHPVDTNYTWKYSLDNMIAGWVASAPIPYKANHLSSVTHKDSSGLERHFFAGGQVMEFESQGNLADNFEFVAATETWIRRASMKLARGHATASTRAIGCGFLMAGGSVNSATSAKNRTNDISYYDIPTDTWTSIGTLSHNLATPIVDIHTNGYMHFVGGSLRSHRRRISVL